MAITFILPAIRNADFPVPANIAREIRTILTASKMIHIMES
jgi:hypothetical protein